MKRTEEKRLYRRAIKRWGFNAQLGVLQEEAAELIQAVSKLLRKPNSNEPYRHLAQELADVEIMIDQIKVHCTWMNMKQSVKTNRHDKMLRLEQTLNELDKQNDA